MPHDPLPSEPNSKMMLDIKSFTKRQLNSSSLGVITVTHYSQKQQDSILGRDRLLLRSTQPGEETRWRLDSIDTKEDLKGHQILYRNLILNVTAGLWFRSSKTNTDGQMYFINVNSEQSKALFELNASMAKRRKQRAQCVNTNHTVCCPDINCIYDAALGAR